LIYLDTSVLLARLFAEDRVPADSLWSLPLVSSRLLEFEVFNRVHAFDAGRSHGADARQLIDRVSLIELAPAVLTRALLPFPSPVRTLDALHLATLDFLRTQGQTVELATYDQRLASAAQGLGFEIARV
jgi:predicted nucleic acid-binding protein